MEKIRILIVDDHKLVREGIKAFIAPLTDMEVVGEGADGQEGVNLAAKLQPDVILLDLIMPRMNGIEATRAILKENPSARILIITSFVEDEKVIAAIRAGASGYLIKDSTPEELYTAIRDIYEGVTVLAPRLASVLVREVNRQQNAPQNPLLTDREIDILKWVGRGLPNQEIAEKVVLSVWTVRTHITNILAKLGLENRTQLALYALREGLVDLEK